MHRIRNLVFVVLLISAILHLASFAPLVQAQSSPDLNGDGQIDYKDVVLLINNFSQYSIFTFNRLIAYYGQTSSIPTPTPIPSGIVAATPPMGWSTWNTFHCGDRYSDPPDNWDENTIKAMADIMVASGLKDAGYQYINIDDCWENINQKVANRGVNDPLTADPKKFPSGIKAVADYVHSKGLKLGIYTSYSTRTCQWRWGSFNHEEQDVLTFASWGIDYLKVDHCLDNVNDLTTTLPSLTQKYRQAIDNHKLSMVLSIAPHQTGVWQWAPSLVNLWRVDNTLDITNDWNTMLRIFDLPDLHHPEVVGPGHFADPDMLEVGVAPTQNEPGMTTEEYKSHFSLWAILAAPLIMGNDIRYMTAEIKAILTNPEVIAVNQDPSGRQGTLIKTSGSTQIWAKSLQNPRTKAVLLFNRGSSAQNIIVNWTDIGLVSGSASVRDLWTRTDRGTFSNSFTSSVSPHGVVMITISQ